MSALAGLLLAFAAGTPSFPCTRAASAAERAICADSAAASADARMAANYASALRRLSPSGRGLLTANQRAFLRTTLAGCSPGGLLTREQAGRPDIGRCLATAFGGRADLLARAVRRAGRHVLLTLSAMRVKAAAEEDDRNFPATVTEAVTLVQIDAPRNAAERRWNAAMRAWIGRARADLPDGVAFEANDDQRWVAIEEAVVSASPTILSARLDVSTNSGGAHGGYTGRAMLWSLPLGRPLVDRDLFRDPRDRRLDALLAAHYDAGGGRGHVGCEAPRVAGRVPEVTAAAMTFAYDPYELGGYPCGGESSLRWPSLAPFLRRPAIVDARLLEVPA